MTKVLRGAPGGFQSSESLILTPTGYRERGSTLDIGGAASVQSGSQARVYVMDLQELPNPSYSLGSPEVLISRNSQARA